MDNDHYPAINREYHFFGTTYYLTCYIFPVQTNLTDDLNHNLTQLHLDTALGQCQTYILLNSTLVDEHPDVTLVIVNLCPNNCSNRGVCLSGE